MQLHEKILFIGARGEYNGMPFEILGSGQVDYTMTNAGDPDELPYIGQTFPAVEYYCLANNGQTWYFAVNDEEVYYCRQLNPDEVQSLKEQMGLKPSGNNYQDYFKGFNWQVSLEESGTGKLQKAEGRALPDYRNYQEFEYFDFQQGFKRYSLDVFPDDYEEWFETVWVPNGQLTEIFEESIRLQNPEADKIFAVAKLWDWVGLAGVIASLLILLLAWIFSLGSNEVYYQIKNLKATEGTQIRFEDIQIQEPNVLHKFTTEADVPFNAGLSLSLTFLDENDEVVSQNYHEYVYSDSHTTKSETVSFFPTQAQTFSLLVEVNDYGGVGLTPANDLKSRLIEPQVRFSVRLSQGGIEWSGWLVAAGVSFLVAIFSFYQGGVVKKSAWKTFDGDKFRRKKSKKKKLDKSQ